MDKKYVLSKKDFFNRGIAIGVLESVTALILSADDKYADRVDLNDIANEMVYNAYGDRDIDYIRIINLIISEIKYRNDFLGNDFDLYVEETGKDYIITLARELHNNF